jgi:hypothetical protein
LADGFIAHNAMRDIFTPRFELGLNERDDLAPWGKARDHGGQDELKGNKGDVRHTKLWLLWEIGRRHVARIKLLFAPNAGIGP